MTPRLPPAPGVASNAFSRAVTEVEARTMNPPLISVPMMSAGQVTAWTTSSRCRLIR